MLMIRRFRASLLMEVPLFLHRRFRACHYSKGLMELLVRHLLTLRLLLDSLAK